MDGTITPNPKYAFGENLGWINFGCDNCNVHVTDTGLTGYAWSPSHGWINLSPSGSGITNNCSIVSFDSATTYGVVINYAINSSNNENSTGQIMASWNHSTTSITFTEMYTNYMGDFINLDIIWNTLLKQINYTSRILLQKFL